MAPQGWPVTAIPRLDHQLEYSASHRETCTLHRSVIEYSENISIIWENLKLSFRICLGVSKSHYKTGSVYRYEIGHTKKGMVLTWGVCEVTGDLCVSDRHHHPSPDFGIWRIPPSLALVAHVLSYLSGAALFPRAHKRQLQMLSSSLGSNLQNRMFLRLKKNKQGKTESYHVSACSGKIWP